MRFALWRRYSPHCARHGLTHAPFAQGPLPYRHQAPCTGYAGPVERVHQVLRTCLARGGHRWSTPRALGQSNSIHPIDQIPLPPVLRPPFLFPPTPYWDDLSSQQQNLRLRFRYADLQVSKLARIYSRATVLRVECGAPAIVFHRV